tara:strand:- start:24 stop:176 length:153 start_codon:yes stop_codon:yes gene_type:complete
MLATVVPDGGLELLSRSVSRPGTLALVFAGLLSELGDSFEEAGSNKPVAD